MVVERTLVRLLRASRACKGPQALKGCSPLLLESKWSLWEKQSKIRKLVWTKSLTFWGAFPHIPCVVLGNTARGEGIFPSPKSQGGDLPKSQNHRITE